MPATITPISSKQADLIRKVAEAERRLAETALWVAKARAAIDANPFDWDAISAPARAGSNAAGDLGTALMAVVSLCDDLDYEASEARYAAQERARKAVRA